jgi:FKBP-type peptidyl-prolyl cis-trans isomerase
MRRILSFLCCGLFCFSFLDAAVAQPATSSGQSTSQPAQSDQQQTEPATDSGPNEKPKLESEDKPASKPLEIKQSNANETIATEPDFSPEVVGSTMEKANFFMGHNFVTQLRAQQVDVHLDQIIKGMQVAMEGKEHGMTREELNSVMETYAKIVRKRKIELFTKQGEQNLTAGNAYIAEFSKKEGAQKLEDGVYYIALKNGDGPKPQKDDIVRVEYETRDLAGNVVDSTARRGKPVERNLQMFIPGFSKALQAMNVGSKWHVVVRGDQAYGTRPPGPGIQYNQMFLCDLELLEILPKKTTSPGGK